jgi:hypothetical protein
VSPRRGTAAFSPTESDYADAVSYEAADAMGWHHSEWDTKDILAVSARKIHASAQWCRYDAAGGRILPNNVSYVITDVGGRWGIQARFGVDSPTPDDPGVLADRARTTWTDLWAAIAAGATEDIDRLVRFPFDIVGTGEVRRAKTPDDILAFVGDAGSAAPGDVTPLHVGERGVNLGVRLTTAGGAALHGLFLVSLHDGDAHVAAASLLPD